MLQINTEHDSSTQPRSQSRPERRRPSVRTDKVVCCPIGDTLLLAIGTGRSAASRLTIELNDEPSSAVDVAIAAWELPATMGSDTHGFAALVPLDAPLQHPPATMRLRSGTQGRRYVVAPRPLGVEDAAALIQDLAGGHFAQVAGSLAETLMEGSLEGSRLAAVSAFLRAGAHRDGTVELLGESHDGELFIRGWWRSALPGIRRVFVDGETPVAGECAVAMYTRDDVPKGATGFVGLLRTGETPRAGGIEGLLFQQRGGWRYVPVHEARTISGTLETPGHVRQVVLGTRGSSDILLRLREAANRFDGSETVSGLSLPVRMGIDHIFDANGGFLLSGWLLDPDGHVGEVRLRGGGADARLDDRWTRYDRPDVTDTFDDHPVLGGTILKDRHTHGFVVFAPKAQNAPSLPSHIELRLDDTRRAFMPLTATQRIGARDAAQRQIRAIDAADWSLPEIIDRQVIPFLSASERTAPDVSDMTDFGPFEEASGPAIVIGLDEKQEQDLAPLLALLALDRETRYAPIVLAVPAERKARLSARIGRLADFYKLSLRLVAANHAADVYDLFEAGAEAVSSDAVVLLAPTILPLTEGWYGGLLAAYKRNEGSIISPTLAYEDHSVRWAGSWIAAPGSERPLLSRYAGYPVGAVTGLEMTRIAAASFECCIMPRKAFFRAGGFSHNYLGTQEKGLDLGLKLSHAGVTSYWLPAVQMLASDAAPGAGEPGLAAMLEQVDRKMFDASWGSLIAEDRTSAREVRA